MGFKEITINMPTDYVLADLKQAVQKKLNLQACQLAVTQQSLDARKRTDIHWQVRVGVSSEELTGGEPSRQLPSLEFLPGSKSEPVLVVGSGPAGMFSALALQQAGMRVTLLERGHAVEERIRSVQRFEAGSGFDPAGNYAFGEGGGGTFSDGKLTSRSKHLKAERRFIIETYIRFGAPEEIRYLTHPHLGTDLLRKIVYNMRKAFLEAGGTIHFDTMLNGLTVRNGTVTSGQTGQGDFEAAHFLLAPGHSSYETYRMLMASGVPFRAKNFAIGTRIEHPQELINRAQWGTPKLAGVKAAEYRLTHTAPDHLPVYTFCMCPGGMVVPAAAYANTHVVNGMSSYQRDGLFANAACVAGVNPEQLLGHPAEAEEVLDWLEALEHTFYDYVGGYEAPACTMQQFLRQSEPNPGRDSSYPLGLQAAPLWELLPEAVSKSLQQSLAQFCKRIRGFDQGNLLGLESKTSAPIQAVRDECGRCPEFSNLYIAGEGSGYAGGIVSSAADGLRAAQSILAL